MSKYRLQLEVEEAPNSKSAVLSSSPGHREQGMDSAIKVLTATPREAGRSRMTGKVNRSQSVYFLRKGEGRGEGRRGEGNGGEGRDSGKSSTEAVWWGTGFSGEG